MRTAAPRSDIELRATMVTIMFAVLTVSIGFGIALPLLDRPDPFPGPASPYEASL